MIEGARRLVEGTRLVLRPHRADDVPGLVAQCSDPLARCWTTVRQPYGPADGESFLRHIEECWSFEQPTPVFWAIDASRSGGPPYCGTIELRPRGRLVVEIAYGAHPDARGRGYMTDAVVLLGRHALLELGMRYVHWQAVVGNEPSLAVARRAGFRVEGTIRGLLDFPDGPRDGWYATLGHEDLPPSEGTPHPGMRTQTGQQR